MSGKQSIKTIAASFAAAGILFAFATLARADGTADCANIQTDKGKVTGTADAKNSVCAYKSIPFAAPPLGELRFAPPAEHAPWAETLQAVNIGNECLQMPMSLMPSTKVTGNEDCLYLNVFHPMGAAAKSKPVMVFIHGGGFVYGSKNWPIYNGATLTSKGDVVVVTINYRLATFGFLVHPSLKDKDGYEGNYALLDQLAALKWVQKNIANFGGDPNNVTVFGESAGGISVGFLLLTPAAKGLFQKAIIESGPIIVLYDQKEKQEKQGLEIAKILGCEDPKTAAECLRAVPAERLIKDIPMNINPISDYESGMKFAFLPSIDGKFLPDTPEKMYSRGDFLRGIPVIIGSNADEASYFTMGAKVETQEAFEAVFEKNAELLNKSLGMNIDPKAVISKYPAAQYKGAHAIYNAIVRDVAFTCPTQMVAKWISKYQPDTYVYLFSKSPAESGMFKDWGAFHGVELAFVFGNFEFLGMKFGSKSNSTLSNKVIAYWSTFARTGKLKVDGLPEWAPYSADKNNYLILDKEISEGFNYQKDACDLFESYFMNAKK
ncbi:MAG: carboxylesterase/lipase family protein [bacterium]